ncbi:hypothetical protein DQ353_02880 [Arthrobacter sp. AQ5-05]|nr:hypothetical protein DQ353_02880 [Arthrobacter sp. AQ5-05]
MALAAPFSSWLDNAMVQADPHVQPPGPPEFNAAPWYWVLIPVAVYAAAGTLGYWRLAGNVRTAAGQ